MHAKYDGRTNYSRREASDGEMAVTMADQLQPNLIFMDMKMPRMKGITAAKRLSKNIVM